jgi:hypothetical protein
MNLLGRRSLSSFFKVLLDVAFYLACLASALLVVAAVVASRADNSNVSVNLPARFEIDPSAYRIQGAGGAAVDERHGAGVSVDPGRTCSTSIESYRRRREHGKTAFGSSLLDRHRLHDLRAHHTGTRAVWYRVVP